MNEVYLAEGTEPISEGYESIEELLKDMAYLESYAYVDYIWDNGEHGTLVRGVDY